MVFRYLNKRTAVYRKILNNTRVESCRYLLSFQYLVCGETNLNGIEGTIKSPKFPRKYPYDQQCHWTIRAPVNHRIVIKFQHFDLEGASKCRFDYLIVKDGENEFSKTIGRYCGSSKPATITTSSNSANLKFNSDTSIARGGFLILWKAVDLFIPTPTAVVGTTTKTTDKPSKPAGIDITHIIVSVSF